MKQKHSIYYLFALLLGIVFSYYQTLIFVNITQKPLPLNEVVSVLFYSGLAILPIGMIYRYLASKYSFSVFGGFSFISFLAIVCYQAIWENYYKMSMATYLEWRYTFGILLVSQFFVYNIINSLAKHTADELKVVKRGTWTEASFIIGCIVSVAFLLLEDKRFVGLNIREIFSNLYILLIPLVLVFIVMISVSRDLNRVRYNHLVVKTENKKRKLFVDGYFLRLLALSVFMYFGLWLTYIDFIKIANHGVKESHDGGLGFWLILLGVVALFQIIFRFVVIPKVESQFSQKVSKLLLPIIFVVFQILLFVSDKYLVEESNPDSYFFYFLIASLGFGAFVALLKGFSFPLLWTYLLPINIDRRNDYQTNLQLYSNVLSMVLAAVAVKYLVPLISVESIGLKALQWGNALFWILFVFLAHRLYIMNLKESLDDRQKDAKLKVDRKALVTPQDQLEYILSKTSNSTVAINSITMLSILHYKRYREWMRGFGYHNLWDNETVQEHLLYHIRELRLVEYIPLLAEIAEGKNFRILRNAQLIEETLTYLLEIKERLETEKSFIQQLSNSRLYKERIIGAELSRYLKKKEDASMMNYRLMHDADLRVQQQAISSNGIYEKEEVRKTLVHRLSEPKLVNVGKMAIVEAGDQMISYLEEAFNMSNQSESAQLAILKAYGEIGSKAASDKLLDKLVHPNPKIASESLASLSKTVFSADKDKFSQLRSALEEKCSLTINNIYILSVLRRESSSEILVSSMKDEIRYNYDDIYKLLSLLYDNNTISLIKQYIWSVNSEESEFALELINITISDDLKPMLLPLLDQRPDDLRLKSLEYVFPVEQNDKHQILKSLLLRDYKDLNRWSRVCVMKELAEFKDPQDFEHFNAHLLNHDGLLAETACMIIKESEIFSFDDIKGRFMLEKAFRQIEKQVNEAIRLKGITQKSIPILQFEITSYLKKINPLTKISGLLLLELAKFQTTRHFFEGDIICGHDRAIDMDYYIIFNGEVRLHQNIGKPRNFAGGQLVSYWQLKDPFSPMRMEALTPCSMYKISAENLNNLLSDFPEIRHEMLTYNFDLKSELGFQEKAFEPELLALML
ncbi:hypothetical protein [Aureibacter tunicatorum]|uniref:Cyclic nucleotide-binding domain-containing protein n=1 Tax=Aureibacter tunicatorum TaxID=866807 RepID=A0AAE3XJC0_9BACT|nr:hypothetical protein [Aureibacter tunicatorum]MDR6237427.1 hypothetical protein [Aureibacter tunicatorum]BDD06417.1 hypothetical protein AUTU_39000 [Aureibacter tunicatorum]